MQPLPVANACDVDEHQLLYGRKGLSDPGMRNMLFSQFSPLFPEAPDANHIVVTVAILAQGKPSG